MSELDVNEKTNKYIISDIDKNAIINCQKVINNKLQEINSEIDVNIKQAVNQ